jgi:hypothetical protein
MASDRYESFEAFWPYYVGEHSKKATRWMHFVGTTAAFGCVAAAVVTRRPALVAAALVAGYGPAWASHFFVENNRPATFTYPLWSLMADFKMWGLMARGEMGAEVDRVRGEAEQARASDDEARATDEGMPSRIDLN